jgi:hypothetical protein
MHVESNYNESRNEISVDVGSLRGFLAEAVEAKKVWE